MVGMNQELLGQGGGPCQGPREFCPRWTYALALSQRRGERTAPATPGGTLRWACPCIAEHRAGDSLRVPRPGAAFPSPCVQHQVWEGGQSTSCGDWGPGFSTRRWTLLHTQTWATPCLSSLTCTKGRRGRPWPSRLLSCTSDTRTVPQRCLVAPACPPQLTGQEGASSGVKVQPGRRLGHCHF